MIKSISTLLMVLLIFVVQSQEISIHKTDGTVLSINLDNIDSITFTSDSSSVPIDTMYIPCPETPTVTDVDGNIYNTVQIGFQCWMAENLNTGIQINGSYSQQDNNTIEKYCYDNNENNCDMYGGLYQWNELMEYTTMAGVKGICPDGWYIPTDDDWKVLEGNVDSLYGVGNAELDLIGHSGTDIGIRLKSTTGWIANGNGTDTTNFTALAAGIRHYAGYFQAKGENERFWTSNYGPGNGAWYRSLNYDRDNIYRNNHGDRNSGFSVRCLKEDD